MVKFYEELHFTYPKNFGDMKVYENENFKFFHDYFILDWYEVNFPLDILFRFTKEFFKGGAELPF